MRGSHAVIEYLAPQVRFLIRDPDAKVTDAFNTVFASQHIQALQTRCGRTCEVFAERWVGRVRRELLDRMLTVSRRHLETACQSTSRTTTGIARIARSVRRHRWGCPRLLHRPTQRPYGSIGSAD